MVSCVFISLHPQSPSVVYVVAALPNLRFGPFKTSDEQTVITSPELPKIKSQSMDPDGHTQCILYESTIQQLLATPGFPQPVRRPTNVLPNRVAPLQLAGAGLGVFTSENINQGDLIFSERAFFVLTDGAPAFQLPRKLKRRPLTRAKEAVIWVRKYEAIRRVHNGGEVKSVRKLLDVIKAHREWDWASRVKALLTHIGMA
ncbi:hypothetical protein V5O48_016222 [Marasmius crinis-equi]|uniref:Uncharacterized protein n=1 Tax=Marasmius crinis-equi TaxID=585013 RepID=A0ABR3ESG9_9AGAR